jgi:hypothetical protein
VGEGTPQSSVPTEGDYVPDSPALSPIELKQELPKYLPALQVRPHSYPYPWPAPCFGDLRQAGGQDQSQIKEATTPEQQSGCLGTAASLL